MASTAFAQAQFKVPGTHATIQDAVNACPANTGCVISLSDPLYKLPNTLLIYEKSNITIKGALGVKPVIQFQDQGLLAGPFFTAADSVNQPAGWKQWPINNTATVGGSKNSSNPYSTSGYQQNGVILIKQSSNITLDNVVIDGVAPLPIGHLNIWDPSGYPTLLGNFGVNLFLSREVTLRNTKIQNCFSALYIFGRNKGGAMARNNQADLDKDMLLPNSQFGYSGQHMVEYSELANNVWGVYVESDWDLGSTFHHNLVYSNYNRDYAQWMSCAKSATAGCPTAAPTAVKGNSEAANHAGGFMYGKDFVTVPYKIYNNTFYQNASIFGYGMWRATTQHLVYNNLITNMYLDYNKSKTGLKTENFKTYFSNVDLISKYTDGIYNNTFAIFPEKVALTAMKVTDSAMTTITRSEAVFPEPRLQVNVQTQKLTWNFQATQYTPPGATTGTYINLATPFKDSIQYWSQANIQYQKGERNFPFNGWELSVPAVPPAKLPTKNYSVLGLLKGVVGTNNNQLPAGVQPGDTIPIMDQANQQQWTALDSVLVQNLRATWTDTLGTIDTIAKKDVRKQTNWFIKSVAFQSVDPKSPKFLEPVWEDPGVDSVILDHGRWGIDPDGSIADVGAKSKSKGTAPSIVLKDGTQAKYDSVANTIRFSFDLVETGGNFVNYQYYIFSYASAVSDDDTPILPYNPKDLALTSIISGVPKPGSNTFEAKLPVKPDPRSRYQVMVVAQTATGTTVYSNMGTWLYKNDGFDMNVMFFDKTTGAQINSARVGQTVVMRVRPVVSRDAVLSVVSSIKYNCRNNVTGVLTYLGLSSKDSAAKVCTGLGKVVAADTSFRDSLDAGKKTANLYSGTLQMVQIRATGLHDVAKGGTLVEPSDIFRTNVKGETSYDVFFTVAGPQIVGANGKDTVGVGGKKASFSGDGKILIRPGLPYMAQFQDPPSVTLADTGFMTQNARVPVKVTVFDSVGNLVDTSSDIGIEITTALGGVSVVGGDPSAKSIVLHLDSANGVFWARTFDPVGSVFFLKSQVVVRDSARVKVMPPKEALKWTYAAGDSIFRYLGQSAPITLTLVDGNGAPALDASAPPFTATLTLAPGLRLALPTNPDSAIASVDILRSTASVDLVVLSDGPVSAGSIAATNPALDDAATFQPITFMPPPVPPTPSVDSAAFRDVDCDGAADHVRIFFKKDPVRRLKDSIQVTDVSVKLPFASQLIPAASTKVVDADSSILDVALSNPIPGTTPSGAASIRLSLKRLSLGDTVVNALVTGTTDTVFGIADRVGPRLVPRAVIWENSLGNPRDTLRFVVSEPVVYTKPVFPLLVWNGGVWKKTAATVLNAKIGVAADTIELDVQGNDGLLVEKAVVRIDPSADIVDLAGNHADDCAGATDTLLVYVKPIPMVSAAIVDVDGNGAADQIHVRFAAKLSKTAHFPDSLVVSNWCDFCGTRSVKLGSSADSINFSVDIVPFEVGKTTGLGLAGQGQLTFRSPMQNQVVDLVDSVGPIPMSAALRFGKDADTLRVVFSEPVSQLAGGSYLMHQSGQALGLTAIGMAASTNWVFSVPSSANPYPAVGDSVYLPNATSRLVGIGGVIPTTVAHPPRVVVQGGDRVPDSALVLDLNADGTADAVRLFYASPLRGNPLYTFTWGGTPVSVDSKTHGAKDSVTLTLPVVGFLPMVTGDPSALGTTQSLVAGALEPAQTFPLKDRVPPVIDSVFVSYGQVEGSADTIRVWASEPIAMPQVNSFLGIESRGVRKPFAATDGLASVQGTGPFTIACNACIETPTTFGLPSWPDRARLQAGIVDAQGNAVGDSSVWVTVFNGLYPTRYRVNLYPKGGVQSNVVPDDAPVRKLPPVSAFILPASNLPDAVWTPIGTTVDGVAQAGNPVITNAIGQSGFYGLVVEMNTSFDADFLAYDNLGVYVGTQKILIDIEDLRARGLLVGGKYTLAVVMNGSNMVGKPVSSGVYMIRLISYGKQNVNGVQVRAMLQNKVFKVGYQRKQ